MSFLPSLPSTDVDQAATLIQHAYNPSGNLAPDQQRQLQQQLFEIQKRREAWGLVLPFLAHQDDNVRFFGAHTVQVKIARDWGQFPSEETGQLRDFLLEITAKSCAAGFNNVVLRKLFVAISSLALKLVPSSLWPTWLTTTTAHLASHGANTEQVLDFLQIVVQEVESADLLGPARSQMTQSLLEAVPMLTQAISLVISTPNPSKRQLNAALKCFEAWVGVLPASDLTPLIPLLLILLTPSSGNLDEDIFDPASSALQEILSKSVLGGEADTHGGGTGFRSLTEPMLVWVWGWGWSVLQKGREDLTSPLLSSLSKLLAALGDHSAIYLASNLASRRSVTLLPNPFIPPSIVPHARGSAVSRAELVQTFLKLVLSISNLPGYYGVDEEESEVVLGFWYVFQEALWGCDADEEDEEQGQGSEEGEKSVQGLLSVPRAASIGAGGSRPTSRQSYNPPPFKAHAQDDFSSWAVENDDTADSKSLSGVEESKAEREREILARAIYGELVGVLRKKVEWPGGDGWARDQREKFQAYRRDVGDTLINAYYVVRDTMLERFVGELVRMLDRRVSGGGWEEIESTLHCILAVQEAVPLEPNPHLARLFGPQVLGRLPGSGGVGLEDVGVAQGSGIERVRRTTVYLIGTYASWFTQAPPQPTLPTSASTSTIPHPQLTSSFQSSTPFSTANDVGDVLLLALTYLTNTLMLTTMPALAFPAANALRDLCDANRMRLSGYMGVLGEVYGRLGGIGDTERAKVLQSIASVIQAMPPEEEIGPIEAILTPVLATLHTTLQLAQAPSTLPSTPASDQEQLRVQVIVALNTIAGVARGLTKSSEGVLVLEESSGHEDVQAEVERMRRARADERVVRIRDGILGAIRGTVEVWSIDASVCDALSELYKAITSLPSDLTLLSLPAPPLLQLLCHAAQRQLTAVWLGLATMLIIQLDPPPIIPGLTGGKLVGGEGDGAMSEAEREEVVGGVVDCLVRVGLGRMGEGGGSWMVENPDVVQAFFQTMDTVANHFLVVFYRLEQGLFNALIQCAIGALGLQERYSLVAACSFLASLINRTSTHPNLGPQKLALVNTHGLSLTHALLSGFAGLAPRSVTPNLIELLSVLVQRYPAESRGLVGNVIFAEGFAAGSRAGREDKERFVKALFGTRSMKRTREAALQFTLVARGLEGSNFGYASVVM